MNLLSTEPQSELNKHQTMTNTTFMKIHVCLCLISLSIAPAVADAADPFLVENSKARAEIIISETPTRTQRLAARELQTYLKKISGAELRIGSEPSADFPVKLYVGKSSYTDELRVTAAELKYGAYRIVSGKDWMVFIGDDTDFCAHRAVASQQQGQQQREDATGLECNHRRTMGLPARAALQTLFGSESAFRNARGTEDG